MPTFTVIKTCTYERTYTVNAMTEAEAISQVTDGNVRTQTVTRTSMNYEAAEDVCVRCNKRNPFVPYIATRVCPSCAKG
jgi:hypothetical protein